MTADPEMVMDAFRLARSGKYRKAKEIRAAFAEIYPKASKEMIDAVMIKLATILEKAYIA